MEFIHALMKHVPPPNKVGNSYICAGDEAASNTAPYATGKTAGNHWVVTGPHLMVFGPPSKALGYTRKKDPNPNKPYMMWAGTPYEHAMIPIGPPKVSPVAAGNGQQARLPGTAVTGNCS